MGTLTTNTVTDPSGKVHVRSSRTGRAYKFAVMSQGSSGEWSVLAYTSRHDLAEAQMRQWTHHPVKVICKVETTERATKDKSLAEFPGDQFDVLGVKFSWRPYSRGGSSGPFPIMTGDFQGWTVELFRYTGGFKAYASQPATETHYSRAVRTKGVGALETTVGRVLKMALEAPPAQAVPPRYLEQHARQVRGE